MDDRLADPELRDGGLSTAAPHPEEMKAAIDLAVGTKVRVRAYARATPAGLIAAALLATSLAVPLVWLLRRGSGLKRLR